METIKKISYIFTREQKFKLLGLLLLIVVGAFLELLGVTAILPFVNVMVSPDLIETNNFLNRIYNFFAFQNSRQLLIFLAVMLIVIYIFKNIFLAMMYHFQYKFSFNNEQKLAYKLMKCYMYQPYSFHLSKNSAELQRNINTDVHDFFLTVLDLIQLVTEGIVCIVLFSFLLIKDKTITISVTLLMLLFVLIFYKGFQKYINKIGSRCREVHSQMIKGIQQSFDGIKDIKVFGQEDYFLNHYNYYYKEHATALRKQQLLRILPRPVLETMCVGSLLLIIIYKIWSGINLEYFVPTLSVFAIAAFRLLPSINRIVSYLSGILFRKAVVDALYHDLKEAEVLTRNSSQTKNSKSNVNYFFENEICLKGVSFKYPNSQQYILKKVDLVIKKYSSIAFIGPSGAGKSTLADLILGVLEPEEGSIKVDGKNIHDNFNAWNRIIGYIPQVIYLMDDTIRNNIAFGIPTNEINNARVLEVIKEAQLDEFILSLEEGMETIVGERGVRLSGGQRQRIGIARALYHKPEILLLDEATSSLDNDTETAVMEAINNFQGEKTLIIIAHRLSTIAKCDYIYEVSDAGLELKINDII
ncbi:MAG TPA: ABC transporter ATP-binding protein [Sedimentibacter sp.]|nr:ABC transporter ATP-binding protein [Sedimentibacter sp.]